MTYDLVIATTTYFSTYHHVTDGDYRRKLWKLFMDSLVESNLDNRKILLLVADDCSPEPPLRRFTPFDSIYVYRSKRLEYNANIIENLNMAAQFAPYCLSVDSDAYFHPDWVSWLFMAIEKYPQAGGWNLYNSPHHRCVKQELEPGIIEKLATQNHGLVYRTADRAPEKTEEWMECFINKLVKTGVYFIVPKISYIQHTGCYGVNNLPKHSQDFDPLFPYNAECGLGDYTDYAGFQDVKFEESVVKA